MDRLLNINRYTDLIFELVATQSSAQPGDNDSSFTNNNDISGNSRDGEPSNGSESPLSASVGAVESTAIGNNTVPASSFLLSIRSDYFRHYFTMNRLRWAATNYQFR